MGNQIRTTLLLGALTGIIIWIGGFFGGQGGMVLALVVAAAMNIGSYWFSDKIVLKMYKAEPVGPDTAPGLHAMVAELARRADLPMPTVYIIPQDTPNAFATGRNPENAVVAVTRGLMNTMADAELAGVVAHELAHIKNRDILIQSIAATLAGAIMVLATMARFAAFFGGGRDDREGGSGALGLIVMAILAPIAAMLIQMAISRSREYLADATGAAIAGSPEGLAKALAKLGQASRNRPMKANAQTAHMFIVNPLSGKSFANLFSTHPPLDQRIARLTGQTGQTPPPPPGKGNRTVADEGAAFWERLK